MSLPLESSRSRIFDILQDYAFWLVDVSPSLAPPYYSLLPVYGFSSITAPEVTLAMREIVQANRMLPVQVVESASLAPMTLVRGATIADGDFWKWIRQTIHGHSNTDKSFLLIQFVGGGVDDAASAVAGAAAQAMLATALGLSAGYAAAGTLAGAFGVMQAAYHRSDLGGGGSWVPRMPARAWMLSNCKATRYKVATDFDATSSGVSLMELDLVMEDFEEFSLV
jgi:hypothetical protein